MNPIELRPGQLEEECGTVLLSLALLLPLLILLAVGVVILTSVTAYHMRVIQIVRHAGKSTMRECMPLIEGGGPDLQKCLDLCANNALHHGSQILPDFKIVISVFYQADPERGAGAILGISSEIASPGSTVAAYVSALTPELAWQRFQPLIVEMGAVTAIEVFAPSGLSRIAIGRHFPGAEEVRYEAAVF